MEEEKRDKGGGGEGPLLLLLPLSLGVGVKKESARHIVATAVSEGVVGKVIPKSVETVVW